MSLKAFAKSKTASVLAAPGIPVATEPKKDVRVSKTVRLTRAQWRRIRELETDTEETFQTLCMTGLSRLFQERGLEPL